jgi:hypothetical protein
MTAQSYIKMGLQRRHIGFAPAEGCPAGSGRPHSKPGRAVASAQRQAAPFVQRIPKAKRRRRGWTVGQEGASQAVPGHTNENVWAPLVTCPYCDGDLKAVRGHGQYLVDIPSVEQDVRRFVIHRFRDSLDEGRVRTDAAGGFNTMMRLKAFLEGKADSRQEVQGVITLEQMQERHRALRAQLEALDPAITGEVPPLERDRARGLLAETADGDQADPPCRRAAPPH